MCVCVCSKAKKNIQNKHKRSWTMEKFEKWKKMCTQTHAHSATQSDKNFKMLLFWLILFYYFSDVNGY